MKKLTQALLFAGVIAVPGVMVAAPAMADDAPAASPITANVTLTTEYVYRGISQSNGKPAIQGGFDYAHPSGFYVGTWGSSITWIADSARSSGSAVSSGMELDVYGGFRGTFADDFGYDVGVLHYDYPGSYPAGWTSNNTDEVYLSGSYKMVSLKYSQSTTNLFGTANSKGSGYFEANANFDLGAGFSLGLHAGHQSVASQNGASNGGYSYSDYKVAVTKDFGGGLSVTGAAIDTNADKALYTNVDGRDLSKQRFVLSVTKTF